VTPAPDSVAANVPGPITARTSEQAVQISVPAPPLLLMSNYLFHSSGYTEKTEHLNPYDEQQKNAKKKKKKKSCCFLSDRTTGIQKFVFENNSEELEGKKKIRRKKITKSI